MCPPTSSHYTERKKCGPRSGQKTTTKMRRLYTAETQLRRRYATETQLQQQSANRTPPSADAGMHRGMTLGAPPPPHATPSLSAGELSGETTCVDHTDYSDNGLPPNRGLLRDESGSSWWSLDDQGGAGSASTRLNSACSRGSPLSQQENRQHHQQGCGKMCDRSNGVGGVGGEHYGCSEVGQGAGLWSGLHSSSAAGAASGSGGSAGESSEDDESEEGLGQAEEEVAALLLGLGKANEEFEGFSDDDGSGGGDNISVPHRPVHAGGPSIFSKPPVRHLSVSNASKEWSV